MPTPRLGQETAKGCKPLASEPWLRLNNVMSVQSAAARKATGDSAFHFVSDFAPAGDQPQAIEELTAGLGQGERDQVLLGVTGSGKTYTMAQVIARVNRPTLVIAPNKTLAAQLYGEMKGFFPDNAVEYFVSYYDYYQPEAYVPRTDTYIEKDASINEQIDRMRHSATRSLMERPDTVIVASVSCIYGMGSPETYSEMTIPIAIGGSRLPDVEKASASVLKAWKISPRTQNNPAATPAGTKMAHKRP